MAFNEETYGQIAAYLNHELAASDKALFESELAQNADLQKEVDAFRSLLTGIEESTFNADTAWNKVEPQLQIQEIKPSISKPNSWRFVIGLAATFLILIGFSWFVLTQNQSLELVSYQTANNQREIVLPDASTIVLAENSGLVFENDFGREHRNLSLEGKAFFRVEKNKNLPFKIKADDLTVEVLGTSFSVSSYEKDSLQKVSVLEGVVSISTQTNTKAKTLTKGDKAVVSKRQSSTIKVEKTNPLEWYWKDKELVFEKTDLKTVMKILNELFKKKLTVKNESLNNCQLTATFKDQEFDDILEVILLTLSLESEKNNDQIILSGEGCER